MIDQNHTPISDQQFFDFIKKNEFEKIDDPLSVSPPTKKYLNLHRKHGQKFFLSWNWAAYFGYNSWFFYRKMYLAGILLFITSLSLGNILIKIYDMPKFDFKIFFDAEKLLQSTQKPTPWQPLFINLMISITITLLSNWFYIRHAYSNIRQNKFDNKGVSLRNFIIFFILGCLISMLLYSVF